ncbi:MAG: hypothetical protein R2932_43665 [Caldilineaceae bacterium]
MKAGWIPTEAINLNVPSIGVSAVPVKANTIIRTVTNVQPYGGIEQYRADIKAPEGYDITVSPNRLRLRPGESATYEMVISNKSAPVDEWKFGSITWKANGNGFEVYSPIAVRGTLLAVPDSISGAGTDGSASFVVDFGYTGSYTAAAHGLEPAVVINDNVLQDPDQDFDPTDVESGGANLHEFTLSGAAIFRVAIPPSATEAEADLDVFVYDPEGNLAASSTNGGTDELVDIILPADGVWQVYVHGWQAPGGDSDYSLSSWVVSATPGGSLTIDAAPTTATLGESGTVEVSWSGLTPDTEYLGAVSHSDDSGIIGLTFVEVDSSGTAAAAPDEVNTDTATDETAAKDTSANLEGMDNFIFIPMVENK